MMPHLEKVQLLWVGYGVHDGIGTRHLQMLKNFKVRCFMMFSCTVSNAICPDYCVNWHRSKADGLQHTK